VLIVQPFVQRTAWFAEPRCVPVRRQITQKVAPFNAASAFIAVIEFQTELEVTCVWLIPAGLPFPCSLP
jgi:hypothetical protein